MYPRIIIIIIIIITIINVEDLRDTWPNVQLQGHVK